MPGQVSQGDGGNDGGPPPRVRNTGHRSLTHRRVALKNGGDCVRRDFHPAGNNHIIGAPQNTQRRGAIVNIASNAAVVPRIGMLAYCTSKAAMAAMSQTVALELAPFGVRCNIVSPGSTDTPMLAGMLGDPAGQRRLVEGLPEQYKLGIPLGKIGRPDDIADAVLFLASDQAGHITMQQIVIDGGATLGA